MSGAVAGGVHWGAAAIVRGVQVADTQGPLPDGSFEERLAAAQRANAPPSGAGARGSAMGTAFRLSTDLVSAVVVGGVIGWGLDWLLGTGPWLLLVFFFLGIAAGILNVIRTAQAMNAAQMTEPEVSDKSGDSGEH